MAMIIVGVDMPNPHCINGCYLDHDGNVFDISRRRIIGKILSVDGLIEKIVNTPSGIDSDKYKTKYDGSAMRQNEIIDIIKEYCEMEVSK